MNKQAERTNHCDKYCRQYRRCAVHWGMDCKRQGGRKIPRMKSYPHEFMAEVETPVATRREKRNRPKEALRNIGTKVVGW